MNPGEISTAEVSPTCGHFTYIPRGSSKCPHGTAANLKPRQAATAQAGGGTKIVIRPFQGASLKKYSSGNIFYSAATSLRWGGLWVFEQPAICAYRAGAP